MMNYVDLVGKATSAVDYHDAMSKLLNYYFIHAQLCPNERDNFDFIFNRSIDCLLLYDGYASDVQQFFDAHFSLKEEYCYSQHKKGPEIDYYIYKKQ